MYENQRILAIIPARAHNDDIDRLNLKYLGDKPLIAYTIEEAKKSIFIDKVYVSTENAEIAQIAKELGVEVPFMRPTALSKSGVTTNDVVRYVVEQLDEKYDFIVTLLPNAPFRTVNIIDDAISYTINSTYDHVIGIQCQKDYFLQKTDDVYHVIEGGLDNGVSEIYRYGGGIRLSRSKYLDENLDESNYGYFLIHEHNARLIHSIYDLVISERLIKLHYSLVDTLIKST